MRPPRCSWLLLVPTLLVAQPAPHARIRAVMERPEFAHAHWGLEVVDVASGRILMSHNGDRLFVPGSTTKVVTMATALQTLGPDHRFRTRVYRTGPVRDGIVQGDLVLVASGDPNLSDRVRDGARYAFVDMDHSYGGMPLAGDPLATLRAMARAVKAHGITGVTGQVIVDASLFPEGARELGTRVVLSPMVVNDNLIDVVVTPGRRAGDPVTVTVSPQTSLLTVHATLTTADSGRPPVVRMEEDSTNADHHVLTITGSVPVGPALNPRWPVPAPSRFGEIAFAEALTAEGVAAIPRLAARRVDPRALAARYDDSLLVAEHVSLPLIREATVLLKTSQNLHASNFPLLLGALGGPGRSGFDIARAWLRSEGLDLDGAVQGDGAGGDAYFSPHFMTQLLTRLWTKPWAQDFKDALPVLGRDGTLAQIQVTSPGAGHVHAKTGTFASVDPLNQRTLVHGKGLAGYFTSRGGREIALAIYVNNVAVAQGDPALVAGQALGEIASIAWEVVR